MQEAMEAGPAANADRKMKAVYTIIERQNSNGQPMKNLWHRIGTAFVNRDSSLNVKLDSLPTNGTLHIRDWEPFEDRNGGNGNGNGNGNARFDRRPAAPGGAR